MKSKQHLFILAICTACFSISCERSAPGPAQTAINYWKYLEEGNTEEIGKMLSSKIVREVGPTKLKDRMNETSETIKETIKKAGCTPTYEIEKEDIVGDFAEVNIAVKCNKLGTSLTHEHKLIRENGVWKLDL